jgi:hypothetical protein
MYMNICVHSSLDEEFITIHIYTYIYIYIYIYIYTGQHPDIFKVACMRNPVTDIPAMLAVSDIPDWCYVEALGEQLECLKCLKCTYIYI